VAASQHFEQVRHRFIAQSCVERGAKIELDPSSAIGTLTTEQDRLASLEMAQDRFGRSECAAQRIERPPRHEVGPQFLIPGPAFDLFAFSPADIVSHDSAGNSAIARRRTDKERRDWGRD